MEGVPTRSRDRIPLVWAGYAHYWENAIIRDTGLQSQGRDWLKGVSCKACIYVYIGPPRSVGAWSAPPGFLTDERELVGIALGDHVQGAVVDAEMPGTVRFLDVDAIQLL